MRLYRGLLALLALALPLLGKAQTDAPIVLLLSLDGYRYDYTEKFAPPNLSALLHRGSHAQWMQPCFPSNTFPNHYTLASGLFPAHHGIVDNSFLDPADHTLHGMGRGAKPLQGTHFGGTPLWNLAQEQGETAMAYHFFGSDLGVQGKYPSRYFTYKAGVAPNILVDTVLNWLKLPAHLRPRLVCFYFSEVDHAGHEYGPDAPETRQAVLQVDTAIGRLQAGLDKLKLPVNFIVVSDHGMEPIQADTAQEVVLSKIVNLPPDSVTVIGGAALTHLYVPDTLLRAQLYHKLKAAEHGRYATYHRDETPTQLHYRTNPRIGDLLVMAKLPYHFVYKLSTPEEIAQAHIRGGHGFDPAQVQNMQAIFYAKGPNIKPGKLLKPFVNVDVYPFICELLQLKPHPGLDGKASTLHHLVQKLPRGHE